MAGDDFMNEAAAKRAFAIIFCTRLLDAIGFGIISVYGAVVLVSIGLGCARARESRRFLYLAIRLSGCAAGWIPIRSRRAVEW